MSDDLQSPIPALRLFARSLTGRFGCAANLVPNKDEQLPANEALRPPKAKVIDQRQQQIDPAGRHRENPNSRPDTNRKQPGGSIDHGRHREENNRS